MESDLAQRMHRLWISLLSIVASSSAFFLPFSPPPNGSSIDSDWSTKNKKQLGFLRLISAWYAMVSSTFDIMGGRVVWQTRPPSTCDDGHATRGSPIARRRLLVPTSRLP